MTTSMTHSRRSPEPPDLSGRLVMLWSAILLLVLAGTAVGMSALLSMLRSHRASTAGSSVANSDDESEVGKTARQGEHSPLEQLRREQRSRLESYGWVDQKNGVARIPITRAVELRLRPNKTEKEEAP